MQIERTGKEIVIRVAAETDLTGLQRILDYVRFREIASKSKATYRQISSLSTIKDVLTSIVPANIPVRKRADKNVGDAQSACTIRQFFLERT
jgi:hypothetical protein